VFAGTTAGVAANLFAGEGPAPAEGSGRTSSVPAAPVVPLGHRHGELQMHVQPQAQPGPRRIDDRREQGLLGRHCGLADGGGGGLSRGCHEGSEQICFHQRTLGPVGQVPQPFMASNGGIAPRLQSVRLVAAVAELGSLGALAMAQIRQSVVALRIIGDDLVPNEITALLGTSPTRAVVKGETGKHIVGPKVGDVRVARSGMWTLDALDRQPEDMNGQIQEIFSRMTDDLSVWQSITSRFRVDLFCGLWLTGSDNGMALSPQSLATLGERGIELGLCIYGDDEQETSA
jgi:hypothetical protein